MRCVQRRMLVGAMEWVEVGSVIALHLEGALLWYLLARRGHVAAGVCLGALGAAVVAGLVSDMTRAFSLVEVAYVIWATFIGMAMALVVAGIFIRDATGDDRYSIFVGG